jgi:predicted membrane channel-forming protein YqfA (hemolysin III family)
MTLTVTVILLIATVAIAGVANILSRRPPEFGKVRLFPYLGVQFLALALALYLGAHVLALLKGS